MKWVEHMPMQVACKLMQGGLTRKVRAAKAQGSQGSHCQPSVNRAPPKRLVPGTEAPAVIFEGVLSPAGRRSLMRLRWQPLARGGPPGVGATVGGPVTLLCGDSSGFQAAAAAVGTSSTPPSADRAFQRCGSWRAWRQASASNSVVHSANRGGARPGRRLRSLRWRGQARSRAAAFPVRWRCRGGSALSSGRELRGLSAAGAAGAARLSRRRHGINWHLCSRVRRTGATAPVTRLPFTGRSCRCIAVRSR